MMLDAWINGDKDYCVENIYAFERGVKHDAEIGTAVHCVVNGNSRYSGHVREHV